MRIYRRPSLGAWSFNTELLRCHFKNNLLFKWSFTGSSWFGTRRTQSDGASDTSHLDKSVEFTATQDCSLGRVKYRGKKESQSCPSKRSVVALERARRFEEHFERSSSVDTENTTLSDLLNRSSAAKRSRRTPKAVWLVPSDNEKGVEFANASETASMLYQHVEHVQRFRQGRLLQGKRAMCMRLYLVTRSG
jgi:hypothetical protein